MFRNILIAKLCSINIKKWFLKLIRGIAVILSKNFIQPDIIRTCWKWKEVCIYSGKLTLISFLIISVAQYGEQMFLKCLGICFFQPLTLNPNFQPWAPYFFSFYKILNLHSSSSSVASLESDQVILIGLLISSHE